MATLSKPSVQAVQMNFGCPQARAYALVAALKACHYLSDAVVEKHHRDARICIRHLCDTSLYCRNGRICRWSRFHHRQLLLYPHGSAGCWKLRGRKHHDQRWHGRWYPLSHSGLSSQHHYPLQCKLVALSGICVKQLALARIIPHCQKSSLNIPLRCLQPIRYVHTTSKPTASCSFI